MSAISGQASGSANTASYHVSRSLWLDKDRDTWMLCDLLTAHAWEGCFGQKDTFDQSLPQQRHPVQKLLHRHGELVNPNRSTEQIDRALQKLSVEMKSHVPLRIPSHTWRVVCVIFFLHNQLEACRSSCRWPEPRTSE